MFSQRPVYMAILAVSLAWGNHAPAASQQSSPAPAGETAQSSAPAVPAGDVVHLRNGRKLEGFRVVRQTAAEVTLQLTAEGLELRLPMSQVLRIERGTGGWEADDTEFQDSEERQLHGVKLAPSLDEKLQAPLTGAPMRLEQRDYVAVLLELSERAGVPLRIADAVHAIPAEERRWTADIPEESSLFAVINDMLLNSFPGLEVSYAYDAVHLNTKTPPKSEPEPASAARND